MKKLDELPNTHQIGAVQSLSKELRAIHEKHPNKVLFYRGHCDDSYEIKPSIYRKVEYLKKEDRLFHEIQCKCTHEFQQCRSNLDKLVKMQHYSLPTRLLDVTSNPLVALYFAANECQDKKGSLLVFVLDPSDVYYADAPEVTILANLALLPFEADVETDEGKKLLIHRINGDTSNAYLGDVRLCNTVLCVKPYLNNTRIIRQSGAFLIFGMGNKKEKMADSNIEYYELKIPGDKKDKVMKDLEFLDINKATLFPDIDHVSDYLKSKCSDKE